MILTLVGHRYLNLEYMVKAEDGSKEPEPAALPPDAIRVTMDRGEAFDVRHRDAEGLRTTLDALVFQPPAAGRKREGTVGVVRRKSPSREEPREPPQSANE